MEPRQKKVIYGLMIFVIAAIIVVAFLTIDLNTAEENNINNEPEDSSDEPTITPTDNDILYEEMEVDGFSSIDIELDEHTRNVISFAFDSPVKLNMNEVNQDGSLGRQDLTSGREHMKSFTQRFDINSGEGGLYRVSIFTDDIASGTVSITQIAIL